jgi:hypothetical protein
MQNWGQIQKGGRGALFGPGSSKGSFARVIRWTEVGGLAEAGEVSGHFLAGRADILGKSRSRRGVNSERLTLCRHEMESGVDVAKQPGTVEVESN